jgi:hypothetical protein
MTPQELQYALSAVEPSAVLVPQRVLENIIQQVSQSNGVLWSVPHQTSWLVDRQILFRHIEQEELALPADHILPASVIVIAWPQEDLRDRHGGLGLLLETWRRLYHATMHRVLEKAWEDGVMSPTRLRQRIDFLTPTVFEEIGKVLSQERLLVPPADERTIFTEFVAVFLELWFFDKNLLASYFPGLRNADDVFRLLDQDYDAQTHWNGTRLQRAPDVGYLRKLIPSEADEYFYHLEENSNAAYAQGNLVLAAIQKQRAARVAPSDKGETTRKEGIALLEKLLEQMQSALDLPQAEMDGWRRLMPTLLDKADQGSRPAEAGLLYDLQRICEDHQSEIYSLDVVEWVSSFGKRPLRRPLPSQRLVRSAHTLRDANQKLTLARLSESDRRKLEALLQQAIRRREQLVRNQFRPKLIAVFQDVGLKPHNVLDSVAFNKMVEETIDQILANGHITFSDLRDTISRNQLRLGDLTDPQDFIRGDALQLLDRRLALLLDGVYHPSEFYLRWLERFTSINFGTRLGRLVTRWVTIPIGGAWVMLEAFLLFVGQSHAPAASVEEDTPRVVDSLWSWSYYGIWAVLALGIMALVHSAPLREQCRALGRAAMRGLHAVFVRFPVWAMSHAWVKRLFQSWSFHLTYWYVIKPVALCGVAWLLWPSLMDNWFKIGVSYLLVTFFVNSRPGEAFWNLLVQTFKDFGRMIRGGLIPSLIRFIVLLYKKIMAVTESLFFAVDELLRVRKGESTTATVLRLLLSVVWFPISYIARFNLVVFIEPCLHPLKLPICLLAAKFVYPLLRIYGWDTGLTTFFSAILGTWAGYAVAVWIIYWSPDVFGFLFWEIKENWALYRANRRETLEPVAIGEHGESMRQLFVPGLHAGTLPRLFRKIREAERRASSSGNRSAVRSYEVTRDELHEKVKLFIEREFCELLRNSPHWHGVSLTVDKVYLSTNQIRIDLHHPAHSKLLETRFTSNEYLERMDRQPPSHNTALRLSFENRAGWILAEISNAGWLQRLNADQRTSFQNALAVLYKLSSVDLVMEQLRTQFSLGPGDSLSFSSESLSIFSAQSEQQRVVPLVPPVGDEDVESEAVLSLWTPENLLYSEVEIRREECDRAFPQLATNAAPPRLVPEFCFLPPAIVPQSSSASTSTEKPAMTAS